MRFNSSEHKHGFSNLNETGISTAAVICPQETYFLLKLSADTQGPQITRVTEVPQLRARIFAEFLKTTPAPCWCSTVAAYYQGRQGSPESGPNRQHIRHKIRQDTLGIGASL